MAQVPQDADAARAQSLNLLPSRQFVAWMHEQRLSFAFTTYQAGKLFLLGSLDSEHLSVFERTFTRCMGLCNDGDRLVLASLYQIWALQNSLEPGTLTHEGYDRLYLPQVGYITGDIDAHDVGVDTEGRILFVNTLFSCLATVSDRYSFVPVWRPPFISRLAAEDRCHLNGLAMVDGQARWVTAVSTTDIADGWREHRRAGGVVVDVTTSEIVARGLSMPHSPRYYQGRLWLLNSGTGHFGYVDLASGRFEPIAFCPGYLRGLCFAGDYAIVGLSRAREASSFAGLELSTSLASAGLSARCGFVVIDLRRGDIVHWLKIEGAVEELYDVVALPGALRPAAIGFKTGEIRRTITLPSGDG